MLNFFAENWPSWTEILLGGPLSLLFAYFGLSLAGWTKLKRNWPTGYSRKVFHFLVFFTAAFLHAFYGITAVFVLGAGTSLVLFYAIWRGTGYSLYEALAREKDAPHQTWYIVVPYLATLVGGLLSNIWFSELALLGYLVAGAGDAIGEPVGTRFGKHHYPVPSLKAVKSTRSLEGSAAVFLVSLLALLIGVQLLGYHYSAGNIWWFVIFGAIGSAFAEAISPHGLDNATMQIFPSFLAYCYL